MARIAILRLGSDPSIDIAMASVPKKRDASVNRFGRMYLALLTSTTTF
jgi:hypothetical protein